MSGIAREHARHAREAQGMSGIPPSYTYCALVAFAIVAGILIWLVVAVGKGGTTGSTGASGPGGVVNAILNSLTAGGTAFPNTTGAPGQFLSITTPGTSVWTTPPFHFFNFVSNQNTVQTLVSFTTPPVDTEFQVSGSLSITSYTNGSLGFTIDYTPIGGLPPVSYAPLFGWNSVTSTLTTSISSVGQFGLVSTTVRVNASTIVTIRIINFGGFYKLTYSASEYVSQMPVVNVTSNTFSDCSNLPLTVVATSAQCLGPIEVNKNILTGITYAACSTSNIVIAVTDNPIMITTLTTSSQCNLALSIFSDPTTGVVYVACHNGGGVISISGLTITTLATAGQCNSPTYVHANINTGVVYAACQSGGGVISIDGAVITTIATSGQCTQPISVFVDSTTGIVYAGCSGNTAGTIISINGATITNLVASSQCARPRSLYTNPGTGIIYAACDTLGVIAINIGALTVTTVATNTQCPVSEQVNQDPVTGVVYAACNNGGVISINGTSVTTILTSTQCTTPFSVYKDSNAGILYAACFSGGTGNLTKIGLC